MEENVDIVNFISSALDSENYKEAFTALNDEKRKARFSDYCWEVIAMVIGKIEENTIIIKPSLYGACEQIISFVLEKCTPEDALLEFIERLELAKNDAQFGIILPVIQKLLSKVTINKKRSLEWCCYAISNYIEKIKIPELQLEGAERKLVDNDLNIRRVTKVYTMVVSFYKPFLDEILAARFICNVQTKPILSDFLFGLLGKPMIFIDIDPVDNSTSEARQSCQTIIQDICKIEKNVLKFLNHVEYKEKHRLRYTDRSEVSPFETTERLNMGTYAGFFYVAYSGEFEIPDSAIPQIYSNEYIIHTLLLAVNHLLKFSEYGAIYKGLALYQALNKRLAKNTSHELLGSSIHYEFCKRLVYVTIYCCYKSLRLIALDCLRLHIEKFEYKGRCAMLKYLIDTSNHSGMIGYAITLYKTTLIESFNDPVLNECFTGIQLHNLIKKICHLPHGAESDLGELADQIITVLNLLRFLILKDKTNLTGIRDIIPTIEKEYLDVLVTALKMSKAHYELKLNDIVEKKDHNAVTVNVGDVFLGSIPKEKKKEIIESALNAFHLMEGLVARVNECIKNLPVIE